MGNKKNKYHKYSRALSSVPKTKDKDLLIQGKNGKLKKINPLEVSYEGSSFGLILDMYHDLQKIHSEYKQDIGHSISTLIAFLKDKGYNTPNIDLNALIRDLNDLVVINPNKEYSVYHKNENDYVVSRSVVFSNDTILEDEERPDDYDKGYYKIIDGKWVLDEDLYKQMWRVI